MDCSSSFGHIQLLRGFRSDFVEQDPVLEYGELAYTLDTNHCLKIGNGTGKWSTLPEACPNVCATPCVKTFRLYSKINYQYTDSSQNLPASSGLPLFDTLIDIPNNTDINLNISQSIDNNGSSVDPETIMPDGQKAVLGIINGEVVTSGSFSGRINTGGRFFIGVNDDNYEDNSGYFLVKFDTDQCTTPPPTKTTPAAPAGLELK